jgi:hypothetical protein
MQLARNRFVNFVPRESEFAHVAKHTAWADASHNAVTEPLKQAP